MYRAGPVQFLVLSNQEAARTNLCFCQCSKTKIPKLPNPTPQRYLSDQTGGTRMAADRMADGKMRMIKW